MKKTFTFLVLSFLILGCNNKKEIITVDENFTQLTKHIDVYTRDIIARGNTTSYALAVYKDGNLYQNYYGEIDKGVNNKPNDSSRYEIASITKTFTGAMVAKAVLEHKISLDDDVRKYLDGDYSNLEFQGYPVTIKSLLTHSIGFDDSDHSVLYGMSNKINRGNFSANSVNYTIENFLDELKTVKIVQKPGTVYGYNSVGPELLAYILEKVNKQSFNKQLQMFLDEIGMHNTYMQRHDQKHKYLINSYQGENLATVNVSPLYGAAGGAVSTLPDLAIYMKYLIEHKNEPWIKEASRALFVDPEDGEQIGYLWQNIAEGREEGYYYSKTGTSNGVQSGVLICPDSNYGIVLLVNNTSDKALSDWEKLFFRDIEPDVIKYPKLNLFSVLNTEFISNPQKAFVSYRSLKKDTTNYYLNVVTINRIGYKLLKENQKQKALDVFKFIVEEYPKNGNAYDSLGEAYFVMEDYDNALLNFKKALEINPSNSNAKNYIKKIEKLSL